MLADLIVNPPNHRRDAVLPTKCTSLMRRHSVTSRPSGSGSASAFSRGFQRAGRGSTIWLPFAALLTAQSTSS
jgi:hypothetical protein